MEIIRTNVCNNILNNTSKLSFKQRRQEAASCPIDEFSVKSVSKEIDNFEAGLEYEKEAAELCNFSYKQEKHAKEVLSHAIDIMHTYDITGDIPFNKKIYDESNNLLMEFSSNCSGNRTNGTRYGVENMYDTVVKEYHKNGDLKRTIRFSRFPFSNEYDDYAKQRFTKKPFIKSIKEYENGELKREIKGSSKKPSNVNTIKLYGDEDKKVQIDFLDGKLASYQKGDFVTSENMLKCPVIFEFDDDKISKVKRNLIYYGFNIINCETFNFENGRYVDCEKIGQF